MSGVWGTRLAICETTSTEEQTEIGRVHTAAIFAWRLGGIGVEPFPLEATRDMERDEGGPGGFREGVGKTEGLGDAGIESDIVDERKDGERGERVGRDLKAKQGRTGRDGRMEGE